MFGHGYQIHTHQSQLSQYAQRQSLTGKYSDQPVRQPDGQLLVLLLPRYIVIQYFQVTGRILTRRVPGLLGILLCMCFYLLPTMLAEFHQAVNQSLAIPEGEVEPLSCHRVQKMSGVTDHHQMGTYLLPCLYQL